MEDTKRDSEGNGTRRRSSACASGSIEQPNRVALVLHGGSLGNRVCAQLVGWPAYPGDDFNNGQPTPSPFSLARAPSVRLRVGDPQFRSLNTLRTLLASTSMGGGRSSTSANFQRLAVRHVGRRLAKPATKMPAEYLPPFAGN